ncbi:hypothetical protein [Pseudomonas sp.]|uniref:hypothetical protein n=1 Tax=Pseudomonas sp. TaxID=306 RepID=UPI0031DE4576
MTTFSDLQARYKELTNHENEYWGHLRECVGEIVNMVAGTLSIPEPRSLRLGVFKESGEFDSMAASILPKKFRSIEFSLLLVLDREERAVPPSTLRVDLVIWREKRNLMIACGTRKMIVTSFDEAASFIVAEFAKVLEDSDPSQQHDFF